jgi:UDP-N-acetylmuramate dehydrogenase
MQINENVPLAPFTTLHIGGPARYLAAIDTDEDLLEALAFARTHSLPTFVLGGGSNLLVSDKGYPGLILHLTLGSGFTTSESGDKTILQADAGLDWDTFVFQTCRQGISGIECLAGIPGLVGASPIQNIGAYGQEVARTIQTVHALDLQTLQFVDLPHQACHFAYRTSIFNSTHRDRYIVTRVDFAFDPAATPNLSYADLAPLRGTNPTPLDVYHAVRAIRDRKAMVIHPGVENPDTRSAGSFFKNPIVPTSKLTQIAQALSIPAETIPHWPTPSGEIKLPAAWLIERAGFPRGFALTPDSPAAISTRHTLALTNRTGTATCADLLHLRDTIIAKVQTLFTITLEQEPVFLH